MEYFNAEPLYGTSYLEPRVLEFTKRLPPGARALDIGCGNGYWTAFLTDRGCDAVGIDPSESGIEIAREQHPAVRFERFEVSTDILTRLGEPPFDFIISIEVIEHIYDPQAFAAACFAALRPGGQLLLSTPYHGRIKDVAIALTGGFDRHHGSLHVGGHIKFFSPTTLERLLDGAGFQNLEYVGAGRVPYLWKSMLMFAEKVR
jgi:2-polyprenyl-6-hydroxyphenyl methylase/3-demethylubiquinone-9 3-methyltransferase